jgi:hypothetical protein
VSFEELFDLFAAVHCFRPGWLMGVYKESGFGELPSGLMALSRSKINHSEHFSFLGVMPMVVTVMARYGIAAKACCGMR